MSVLENPEVLKRQNNELKTHNLPLTAYKIDYVVYPEGNRDYQRRTAYILAESSEAAELMIVKSVARGMEIQWEQRAGYMCEIHAITPTLERALYLSLKEKYEGPSAGDKLAKIKRG